MARSRPHGQLRRPPCRCRGTGAGPRLGPGRGAGRDGHRGDGPRVQRRADRARERGGRAAAGAGCVGRGGDHAGRFPWSPTPLSSRTSSACCPGAIPGSGTSTSSSAPISTISASGVPADQGDSIYNGADDNASGVAAVSRPRAPWAGWASAPAVGDLLHAQRRRRSASAAASTSPASRRCRSARSSPTSTSTASAGAGRPIRSRRSAAPTRRWGSTVRAVAQEHPDLALTVVDDQWPDRHYFASSDQIWFARRGVPSIFLSSSGPDEHYHRVSDEAGTIEAGLHRPDLAAGRVAGAGGSGGRRAAALGRGRPAVVRDRAVTVGTSCKKAPAMAGACVTLESSSVASTRPVSNIHGSSRGVEREPSVFLVLDLLAVFPECHLGLDRNRLPTPGAAHRRPRRPSGPDSWIRTSRSRCWSTQSCGDVVSPGPGADDPDRWPRRVSAGACSGPRHPARASPPSPPPAARTRPTARCRGVRVGMASRRLSALELVDGSFLMMAVFMLSTGRSRSATAPGSRSSRTTSAPACPGTSSAGRR